DRVSFRLRGPPVVVHDSDGRGRMLYGISADATVEGQDLQIRQAVLSSIRVLRDYQLLGTMPSALAATPTEHGHTVSWSRDRLDALRHLLRAGYPDGGAPADARSECDGSRGGTVLGARAAVSARRGCA